jgi:hypothetical protein
VPSSYATVHMKLSSLYRSPLSPERLPRLLLFRAPLLQAATQESPLTNSTFMVQYVLGNTLSPFGVRQFTVAFLLFPPSSATGRRTRSFWNQSLANCRFLSSFVLKFMQNDGGVGGTALCTTAFCPIYSASYPLSPFISCACALFCTLLHSFAKERSSTPFLSWASALFVENWGCGGRAHSERFPPTPLRVFFMAGRSSFWKVPFFGCDLACV